VYKLKLSKLAQYGISEPSATFHGRDIFAPIAAEIAAGRITASDVGIACEDWTPGWVDEPDITANRIRGAIITIDAFGNLISNIDAGLLDAIDQPVAQIAGHTIPLLQTYGRATPGDLLALVNSFGVIEIAKAEGSAADALGLERGAPLTMRSRD